MLLAQFNGGLNTKIAPTHIATNEATVFRNVDNSEVILKPIKGNTATGQNFGSDGAFTYFLGEWISGPLSTKFVEFNNALYYYDEGTLTKKGTFGTYTVGISGPTTSALAVANTGIISYGISDPGSGDESDIPNGFIDYFLRYWDETGAYEDVPETHEYLGSHGVALAITLGLNSRVAAFRRLGNVFRHLGTSSESTTIYDTVEDIEANDSYSDPLYSDPIDIRQYCYTYYRAGDGTESAPSLYSNEIKIANNDATLTGFLAPSDTSVTHIRIYRIGGLLTRMTLVDEVATSTTEYHDTYDDSDLTSNSVLLTTGTISPPSSLNHLTLHVATLFAVDGARLYYSEAGLVDLWSAFNYIDLPSTINGLGSTQNGLLIFLRNRTYILTGSSSSNFVLHLLSDSQGCISNTTTQYAKNTLLWLSLDGVCASTGGDIQVITEAKLGKLNLEPVASAFYENQYYLFHEAGTLVIDFRYGTPIFKELDLIANGAYYSDYFDKLYYIDPNDFGMYELGTSETPVAYEYKTGYLIGQSLTNVKVYKNAYVYVVGTVTMSVYQDGVKTVDSRELTTGLNDIKLPQANLRSYYIEIEFSGTGSVYEVEFKTEDRTNGR
jgi:hypothetical protein